jgi:hypothetical protein
MILYFDDMLADDYNFMTRTFARESEAMAAALHQRGKNKEVGNLA